MRMKMPRDRPSSRKGRDKIAESGAQHGSNRSDRTNVITTAGVAPAVFFYGTGLLEACLFQQRKDHAGASAPDDLAVVRPEKENRAFASVVWVCVMLSGQVCGVSQPGERYGENSLYLVVIDAKRIRMRNCSHHRGDVPAGEGAVRCQTTQHGDII